MSEKLPEGTVTYLFTDVEEHSHLWQAYPQAMPLALAKHDAMLETAVRKHRGHVVKNTGDGIFAVFATAYEAIGAAIDAQLALVGFSWDDTGPLRVRMAAHTGEAHIRDGDYFGTAVIRAARIMSLAAGGQILLSGTTARLLHDHLPREISLIGLGQHRLKGLQRPAQLFQLQHPALPAEFPDLKSLDRVPNNLPLQVTSFIGREQEISDLSLLLSGGDDRAHWPRLITLTGTGGTGKTRLSLEVAADHLEHYPDGVWLLELAALTEDAQVAQALASVLKLGEPRSIGLLDLLTSYLRSRKVLIIIDNCEHLIGACALLCDHLLHICPELQLLATSREALGISGETIFSLPPLELPESETVTTEDLLRSDAGQLFIERATAVKPHIQISYDDALAIAQICHRLDGIPLAIELAAARVNVFTPQQIERRLGDRFRLLTGGSRAALPRQQTLSALVDWSYQLLSKDEKELLRRVAVFKGGWTFETAEAIWGDSLDIIQLLPQLINKSMVSVDEDVDVQRYRLLETIRRFAQNKLSDHNEMQETRNDHLAYYDRLASIDSPQTADILDVQWLNRCQQELDNYRAALAWAVEEDPDAALRISGNLSWFWARRGYAQEGRDWLENALSATFEAPIPPGQNDMESRSLAVATAHLGLSQEALIVGDFPKAQEAMLQCVELLRALTDNSLLPFALGMLGFTAILNSDLATADYVYQESLGGVPVFTNKAALSLCYSTRSGLLFLREGELAGSQKYAEKALSYALESGSAWAQLAAVVTIARLLNMVARGSFDYRSAFDDIVDAFISLEDFYFANVCRSELAHAERLAGHIPEAETLYRQSIVIWHEIGQKAAVAHQLECFAILRQSSQQFKTAAMLFGAAEALREQLQATMIQAESEEYNRQLSLLRQQLPEEDLSKFWQEGRQLDIDSAINLAQEK